MNRVARMVWRILRAPFAWLGPEAASSGRSVFRRTRTLLRAAGIVANVAGIVVVFVFSAWVIPAPDIDDPTRVLLVNLVATAVYALVALVLGAAIGNRRFSRAAAFLREDRAPEPGEQRAILRWPMLTGTIAGSFWAVAVLLFGWLNAAFDPLLGLGVALTVALGGITTSAVAYLLAERLLRAATAHALAAHPPDRPLVPGVIFRSLLAWALGTGVPIVGILIVAVFALTRTDITRTDMAITALALAGVALFVGFFAVVLAARAASDPVVSVRDALSRVEKGDLDVEVPVYDGSEVGLLQAGFNRMVEGLRERRRIREVLGAYVDHDVAEHILEEGVSLEGEEVEVTLMFLDVRDFTAWAERTDPREVVEGLNGLFELVVPMVHERRGHIDKFVGDGLLAVFGAPRRDDEHADQALGAALEIDRAVRDDGAGDLQIGIGLNSGRVVAGNVGGGGRLEFSVIGDTVNVAARIEAATRETGDPILLSEHTVAALRRDEVELEERPDVELRGKSERVRLYAVARRPGA
jgi:adenylate cyclase